ncbi:MAG: hypothetical protein KAX50_10680 [Saprospiraceae bacterium]|nr:hypothetical protein [Saprospiraceae bacterium]
MKHLLLISLFAMSSLTLRAQSNDRPPVNFGLELDALPYLTGGYFGAAWVGRQHWRLRVLITGVNKPDWATPDGFTKHHITSSAAVADFFLKPDWKGWWIGGGPVYWSSTIQTDAKLQTAQFKNLLLNGSIGYNLRLPGHFYLSPWAGLSIRVAGDTDVPVDNTTFTLPLLNPEASLKLGWYF